MRQNVMRVCFVLALLCVGAPAFSQEDISKHRECSYCGMDRKAYGYSRMLVQYEDGAEAGVCSLHCAVIELRAYQARKVKALLVADRDSRALIDASRAVWVMGGGKRGVMTRQPKWAFETPAAAEAFIRENGGTIVSWADALAAAQEEAARESR